MQVEKGLHTTENKRDQEKGLKLNLHKRINWSVQIEELTARITPIVSNLQLGEPRTRTPKEKLENSKKVVSREIIYFKIMKFVYNKTIYIKTF